MALGSSVRRPSVAEVVLPDTDCNGKRSARNGHDAFTLVTLFNAHLIDSHVDGHVTMTSFIYNMDCRLYCTGSLFCKINCKLSS